jgi:hypothetical protein
MSLKDTIKILKIFCRKLNWIAKYTSLYVRVSLTDGILNIVMMMMVYNNDKLVFINVINK